MRIMTFSIVAGSEICNARCPFCISKMTPPQGVESVEPTVNWRNFHIACRLAERSGAVTAMFTGKGEPTIFPKQITAYLQAMQAFDFPLIELQSNGILIADKPDIYEKHLRDWYAGGLSTIAISIVHYEPEPNRQIYLPYKDRYIDLPALIRTLHEVGFSVRLACIMAGGFIDSRVKLEGLIDFAQSNEVEQLTIRPVNRPANSRDVEAFDWTNTHKLSAESYREIRMFLENNAHPVMTLQHGATVYDVHGQNVCLTDSLTIASDSTDIRQLIFFPDGHLRYDWQYPGAILL